MQSQLRLFETCIYHFSRSSSVNSLYNLLTLERAERPRLPKTEGAVIAVSHDLEAFSATGSINMQVDFSVIHMRGNTGLLCFRTGLYSASLCITCALLGHYNHAEFDVNFSLR